MAETPHPASRYVSIPVHLTLQPSVYRIVVEAMRSHGEISKSRAINQIVSQALVAKIPYLTNSRKDVSCQPQPKN